MENLYCNMCCEDWKNWVTQQRQEYSQRVKLAHLIRESESTFLGWPTARTSDAEGGRIETEMTEKGFKSKRHKSNQTFGAKLRDAVETHEQKAWGTPKEQDSRAAMTDRGKHNLGEQVHGMYNNQDSQQDQMNHNKSGKNQELLANMRLNPNWVEQMMGLPVGWTQLPTEWID
jgi:hypothetical protein